MLDRNSKIWFWVICKWVQLGFNPFHALIFGRKNPISDFGILSVTKAEAFSKNSSNDDALDLPFTKLILVLLYNVFVRWYYIF